jgi:hypothetical protein
VTLCLRYRNAYICSFVFDCTCWNLMAFDCPRALCKGVPAAGPGQTLITKLDLVQLWVNWASEPCFSDPPRKMGVQG